MSEKPSQSAPTGAPPVEQDSLPAPPGALPPDADLAQARRKAAEAETKRLRGDHISAVYEFRSALGMMDPELARDPDGSSALPNWCRAHLAASLGALGLAREAESDFYRVLANNPEYAWAWAQRGESRRIDLRDRLSGSRKNKGAFDELSQQAYQDFSEAIRLKPEYAWALAHRGALTLLVYWYYTTHTISLTELPELFLGTDAASTGNFGDRFRTQVNQDLEWALRLEPVYPWAKLFQGLAQNLFDDHVGSRTTLTNVLTFGTNNNIPVLVSLAMSHIYSGDLASASVIADQILRLDSENPTGQFVRAKVLEGSQGPIEREVFNSFKARLTVTRDRIDAMLEDLNDTPRSRAELDADPGASLDNIAIRTRLRAAKRARHTDSKELSTLPPWTEQCAAYDALKAS